MEFTDHDGQEPLLVVEDLTTVFALPDGGVRTAVDGVGFTVRRGEIRGVVGESGSGKSGTAMSLLRLVDEPGRIVGGDVRFDGTDVLTLDRSGLQRLRGSGIGVIFQEPGSALNPVLTVGDQVTESLRVHRDMSRREAHRAAVAWLARGGRRAPEALMSRYPHELSGGMLQRVMIAMALCAGPKLLIADEPSTALDVTTQAQILDLLLDLRDELGLAILFITHDLGVVARIADTVTVMYGGRVMEQTDVLTLFDNPSHPYTRALLATSPVIGRTVRRLPTIPEDVRRFAAGDDGRTREDVA
ncbi:MAG: ABC transporter ATP-binding protein [Corynebacterium sp.]|nr:ABC transporter ATP-binding protein [Corynebacterium sp.]